MGRSANSVKTASNVSILALQLAAYSTAWPDVEAPTLFQQGGSALGPQPSFGIYREKVTAASSSIAQMVLEHNEARPSFKTRPPPIEEEATAIFAQTIEEQRLGFLSEFMTEDDLDIFFGTQSWSSMPRFPVLQKAKCRMIDNGAVHHNGTFESNESIHTTSSAAGAALARNYRWLLGKRLTKQWRLKGGSRDMWKAYRQIQYTPINNVTW